jgi:hypothetical protein
VCACGCAPRVLHCSVAAAATPARCEAPWLCVSQGRACFMALLRSSHCRGGVQIIVNPHEVMSRSRGMRSASSAPSAALVLAVLGCAALACLAVSGGDAAASPAAGTLAEAQAALSRPSAPARPVVVPQASRAHFSAKAHAASGRMHATQQHLALAKQVLHVQSSPPLPPVARRFCAPVRVILWTVRAAAMPAHLP